jgi:pre-rRNA-processing protein TSR1
MPPHLHLVHIFNGQTANSGCSAVMQGRATSGSDPCSVLPGSWVTLVLGDVPAAAAAAIVQQTTAATAPGGGGSDDVGSMLTDQSGRALEAVLPLVVYGLLQHEAKLSVVNFSMKKVASYGESIRSKEELLLVFGLRSFMARPVLSDDGQGSDKYKMDRFLQDGKTAVGSVYAPISYPPLPMLAFKVCCPVLCDE